jgi:hypothetical protein
MAEVVNVNLKGLEQFAVAVRADLRQSANGPIRKALKRWAERARSFWQERFSIMSRGGWPALEPSTIKARNRMAITRLNRALRVGDITQAQYDRRIKGARSKQRKTNTALAAGTQSVAILMDTGTLFHALDMSFSQRPGQLNESIPFGIRVGFGGPGREARGGRATVADIAGFHQVGAGHNKVRKIIVPLPDSTKQAMAGDMQTAVREIATEAAR